MGNSPDSISLSIQTGDHSIPLPIFLSLAGNALSEQKLRDWLKAQGLQMDTYTTTLHVAFPIATEQPPPAPPPFGPLFWPTNYVSVTQPFGANPAKYGVFGLPGHEGIDITAPTGTPIYASDDGTVSVVGTDLAHAYGNHVRIKHRDGYQSIYAHHQKNLVTVGQKVVRGQEIGDADSTGNSTGSHCHFSLKKEGATGAGYRDSAGRAWPHDFIDPTPFFAELVPLIPQSGLLYELAKSAANVRTQPVVGDNVITTLLVGNQFTATGKTTTDKGWWEIMLLDGRKGWMYYWGNGVKVVS